jgi:hypothetical protein
VADTSTGQRSPEKCKEGPSRSREGVNVPFEPSGNGRRKGILNLHDRCPFPIFCSLQVRDCVLRGLLAEEGKAIKNSSITNRGQQKLMLTGPLPG